MNCRSPPGPCANWSTAATDLPPPPGAVRFDTVGRLMMLVEERGIHWKIWKTYAGMSQTVTNCEMKSCPRWCALKENLRGGMSQNFETTHDISRRCAKNDSLWPLRFSKSGWPKVAMGYLCNRQSGIVCLATADVSIGTVPTSDWNLLQANTVTCQLVSHQNFKSFSWTAKPPTISRKKETVKRCEKRV